MLCSRNRLCSVLVLCALADASSVAQVSGPRQNVAFLVWDDVELIEFTGPAQVFHFAGFRGFTVAEKPDPVRSYFVTITPEFTFENCPRPDIVVVPAGVQRMKSAALNGWLKRVVPQAEAVLTVCNGSLILANTGLLDGHEATCPAGNFDDLMILGRDVRYVKRRFVESGKFVTSDSYFAGVDGALHLVGKLRGADAAARIARSCLYDWRPEQFAAEANATYTPPRSRRREMFQMVMRDGVDKTVARYRELKASGDPGYDPPFDKMNEQNMFCWLAWNLQNARRYEEAAKLCEFSAAAFPDSAMARACLGEACVKAGRGREALGHLLRAAEMQPGQGHALHWLRMTMASPEAPGGADARKVHELIRAQCTDARDFIPPEDEPGEPLVVSGVIRDADGKPVRDAIVYLFHTDARGLYSRDGMDEMNPRLFAYLRTAADGAYEVRTIRPARYPNEPVEQHIHYEITAAGFQKKIWRLGFADDPHWNGKTPPRWVAPVTRGPDGVKRSVCDIVMER